jgi:hypothetical protein
MNELYQSAIENIQLDVLENKHGYLFEQWVEELEDNHLRYLVWKITNSRSEIYDCNTILCNNTIFEYFHSLNIGYVLQSVRGCLTYDRIHQRVLLDISNQSNGTELHNYLKNDLSEYEVNDAYTKINEIRRYIGANNNTTFCREFNDWFEQPGLMSHKHFAIHCHFAELGLGYYFQIQNIPGYISRNERRQLLPPPPIMAREEEVVEEPKQNNYIEIKLLLKTDLLSLMYFKNENAYPIQYQIDYDLFKTEPTTTTTTQQINEEDCCAVCMETKEKKEYLTTNCNHDFCNVCVGKMMVNSLIKSKSFHCPLCRTMVQKLEYTDQHTICNIIPNQLDPAFIL